MATTNTILFSKSIFKTDCPLCHFNSKEISFDSAVIVRYDEYITDDVSRMPRDFLTQQLRV